MRKLVLLGQKILNTPASKVTEFNTNFLDSLIKDMFEAMYVLNGVGLAAQQINVPLRVVVIDARDGKPFVMINPKIVKTSGERFLTEGCLSVPGIFGVVKRSQKVTVKAHDIFGKEFRIKAEENLLAQVIEHECNHVSGELFTKRLVSKEQ